MEEEAAQVISISITHNFPDVQRRLRALHADLRDRVTVAALNKTADKARTEMVRGITTEFNIKAAEVRPRVAVRRASAKGSNLRVVAAIEALPGSRRGRAMNVIHFLEKSVSLAEARRRQKSGTLNQLRFKFKRTGGMKTIPGAFVLTANRGTFVARRLGKARTPIEAVQVIDVPQMFNTQRINKRVLDRIRQEFPIEFDRAARVALERFNRG
jgi:hypothetical protein